MTGSEDSPPVSHAVEVASPDKSPTLSAGDEKFVEHEMLTDSDGSTHSVRVIGSDRPSLHRFTQVLTMAGPWLNKGSLSNAATFTVMLVGMALKAAGGGGDTTTSGCADGGLARWVLAAGLFGFAGGITNWLAIKMLFDRVCGLPGSGVIPNRFKEIREVVKNTIMKTFFDGPYLEQYMNKKMASLAGEIDLGAKIQAVLESPEVDEMITKALTELANKCARAHRIRRIIAPGARRAPPPPALRDRLI